MATINLTIPMWSDGSGDDPIVDVLMDDTVVVNDFTVASSDASTPNEATCSVTLTEGSHTLKIQLNNPPTIDNTPSICTVGFVEYTTDYEVRVAQGDPGTMQRHMYEHQQYIVDANTSTGTGYYRNLNTRTFTTDLWTALSIDGLDMPDEGETAWQIWGGNSFTSDLTITWNYAVEKRNEWPYRLCLDHDADPHVMSVQICQPWETNPKLKWKDFPLNAEKLASSGCTQANAVWNSDTRSFDTVPYEG